MMSKYKRFFWIYKHLLKFFAISIDGNKYMNYSIKSTSVYRINRIFEASIDVDVLKKLYFYIACFIIESN